MLETCRFQSYQPSQENVYVFNVAELISNVSTTTVDVVAGLIATKPQHGNRGSAASSFRPRPTCFFLHSF